MSGLAAPRRGGLVAATLARVEGWLLEPAEGSALDTAGYAAPPPPPIVTVVPLAPRCGGTTVARGLAVRLRLPLIAKDTIKEALASVLPPADVPASQRLGRASVVVLLALAHASGGAQLESVWYRSRALPELAALPGDVVEVFCRVDRETAFLRYRSPRRRGPGHFDATRGRDELWNDEVAVPVAGGWPVVDVDTTDPVDPDALLARLAAHGVRPRPPG